MMTRRFGQVAMTGVILGVFAAATAYVGNAQTQLPEAPGKAETVKLCGTCHPADRAASVRLTRVGWQDTMQKMVGLGLKASDQDLDTVLEYLATNFKGEGRKPLNLNTATAIDLESIVGMLRKESAAWIAARKAQGPCKTIDDLKKINGIDFSKIEERRERLVCF
jgi:competence protein ComEA